MPQKHSGKSIAINSGFSWACALWASLLLFVFFQCACVYACVLLASLSLSLFLSIAPGKSNNKNTGKHRQAPAASTPALQLRLWKMTSNVWNPHNLYIDDAKLGMIFNATIPDALYLDLSGGRSNKS